MTFKPRLSAIYRSKDARSAFKLGLATVLGPIAAIAMNVVVARVFGASGRGDLAAIAVAFMVAEVLLVFGTPDIIARYIAKGSMPVGGPRILASWAVAISIVPAAAIAVYCHHRGFIWSVAVPIGVLVSIAIVAALARGVALGRLDYRTLFVSQIIGAVVRLVAPLLLLIVPDPTIDLALLLVMAWIPAAAAPLFASRPFTGKFPPPGDLVPILRESLVLWPSNAIWPLYARLDQLVLAVTVLPADLGRYVICASIAEVLGAVAGGLRQVLFARVAGSQDLRGIPLLAAATIPMAASVGVISGYAANPILVALFGPDFGNLSITLALLIISSGFDIASSFLASGLIAVGRVRPVVIAQLTGLVALSLTLSIVVSLGGGLVAVAAARLGSAVSVCLLCFVAVHIFRRSVMGAT